MTNTNLINLENTTIVSFMPREELGIAFEDMKTRLILTE